MLAHFRSAGWVSGPPDQDWPGTPATVRTVIVDVETGRQRAVEPEDQWRIDRSVLHTGSGGVAVLLDFDATTVEDDQ